MILALQEVNGYAALAASRSRFFETAAVMQIQSRMNVNAAEPTTATAAAGAFPMKVVLTTSGKFHTFDLARQMHKRDALAAIYTGYPAFQLKNEQLPAASIRSFPWLHTLYMARRKVGLTNKRFSRELAWWGHQALDAYAAATLPPCDVFVGLSASGLATGRKAQSRGAAYVCDRGSSHIRYQDNILREEYRRNGAEFDGVDPRVIAKEEAEYAAADLITVPSNFVKRSFVEMGVPEAKLRHVPYGVDLSRFEPAGKPDPERFDVLFVGSISLRKGIAYLLEAIAGVHHPRLRLTFVGTMAPEARRIIDRYESKFPISCLGHVPQSKLKEIMSASHVLVLPSIEEGLALVQAQALACGCPVIGTTNSGIEDLIDDDIEGYVVPIRCAEAITDRLQRLADDFGLRERMSAAALERVRGFGGWDTYGDRMYTVFSELAERKH